MCDCNKTSILFPENTADPTPFDWDEVDRRVRQLIPPDDWTPIIANAYGVHPAFATRISYDIWALQKISSPSVAELALTLTSLATSSVGASDGSISAKATGGKGPYKYRRLSTQAFSDPTSETYLFSGLVSGNYTIDTQDATGKIVSKAVNVPSVAVNANPVANAGTDKTIQLPTSTVTLTGSGTDSDGTIASYAWVQVSGPLSATLTEANTSTANVSGLTAAGNYMFALVVTDNKGATSVQDTVQVTVLAAGNQPLGEPTITSFTPSSGLNGSTVTITGTNFIGVTNVRFNGLFSSFVAVNSTTITATVPASATTGKITVETSNGNVTSSNNFTVTQPASFNTTLNSSTREGAGVSFAPASTEELKFNAIPGANQTFINSLFSYNGANSFATLPGEYTGQAYSFRDNAGVIHTGTFSNNG